MKRKTDLAAFLDPNKVEKALEQDTRSQVRKAHFQFIIVNIDESDFDQMPFVLNDVIGIITAKQASIVEIASNLVIACLGVPDEKSDSAERRLQIVAALSANEGNRIRVAHGECKGWCGLFGAANCWRYGMIVPGFSSMLERLLDTPFGVAIET